MTLRLALLGAFRFPALQGSQRFAADQARALASAGAEVTLFCYGRGDGRPSAGFELVRSASALAPALASARLDPRKLPSDLALLGELARAQRARPFDALLAHNAEAALLALAARAGLGVPVVYVAHTLWAEELPAHLSALPAAPLRALGSRLDRALARRADAILALSDAARDALAAWARGPLARIAPGLVPEPAPEPAAVAAICRQHGLPVDGFALYAGNLDRYQDLPELEAAAALLPRIPIAVATHDRRALASSHLRCVRVTGAAEMRALAYGARVCVAPRRRAGGFPLKLLDYMDAGRAIVARACVADTLVHGESAWLLAPDAPAGELAGAIQRCFDDAALRGALGAGARRTLAKHHDWPTLALHTLALVEAVRGKLRAAPASS